jgi:hypothetical protein
MIGPAASILGIVLAALGTWFLVREVAKGHKFEEMSRELEQLTKAMSAQQEMAQLYAADRREFWIRCQMDSYRQPREAIESLFGRTPRETIEAQTEEFKKLWQDDVPTASARFNKTRQMFEELFAPAQLKRRKLLLWLGFTLLMLGAGLQVVAVVASNAASFQPPNTRLERTGSAGRSA